MRRLLLVQLRWLAAAATEDDAAGTVPPVTIADDAAVAVRRRPAPRTDAVGTIGDSARRPRPAPR